MSTLSVGGCTLAQKARVGEHCCAPLWRGRPCRGREDAVERVFEGIEKEREGRGDGESDAAGQEPAKLAGDIERDKQHRGEKRHRQKIRPRVSLELGEFGPLVAVEREEIQAEEAEEIYRERSRKRRDGREKPRRHRRGTREAHCECEEREYEPCPDGRSQARHVEVRERPYSPHGRAPDRSLVDAQSRVQKAVFERVAQDSAGGARRPAKRPRRLGERVIHLEGAAKLVAFDPVKPRISRDKGRGQQEHPDDDCLQHVKGDKPPEIVRRPAGEGSGERHHSGERHAARGDAAD